MTKNKKTMKDLENLLKISTKKKIKNHENLDYYLDSLEYMTFLSNIEKKFRINLNIPKILNKKKINLKYLYSQLK